MPVQLVRRWASLCLSTCVCGCGVVGTSQWRHTCDPIQCSCVPCVAGRVCEVLAFSQSSVWPAAKGHLSPPELEPNEPFGLGILGVPARHQPKPFSLSHPTCPPPSPPQTWTPGTPPPPETTCSSPRDLSVGWAGCRSCVWAGDFMYTRRSLVPAGGRTVEVPSLR